MKIELKLLLLATDQTIGGLIQRLLRPAHALKQQLVDILGGHGRVTLQVFLDQRLQAAETTWIDPRFADRFA